MRALLEHGLLNLEVAGFTKRSRGIHDQVIFEEEFSQRMVPVLVERPISFSVEAVVESEIGVQPCAIRSNVVLGKVEGVFIVVQVANLEIRINRIEYLGTESDILYFRPANPLQTDRTFAGRQSFADDSEQGPALEQSCPVDSQHNSQDILAVESVGTDLLERELSRRERLCGHRTVKEERIGPLSCEDMQAVAITAILVVHGKGNGLA